MVASIPFVAHQPLKALFVFVNVLYCFLLRTPLVALYYISAINRQDATWTWKQAVGISTGKFMMNLGARVRFARVFPVNRTLNDPKRPCITAVTEDDLAGVLLDSMIKPADLMAEWYPAPYNRDIDFNRNTKVVIFMFGGAYVMGGNEPSAYSASLKPLCPALNAKVLLPAYRLAGSAGGQPFPSQLQDLLSVYNYVLKLGVPPENVILAGESAGGNTVVSFIRHLHDYEPDQQIPLPGMALLSSPWIDLTPDPWKGTMDRRYRTDLAAVRLLDWGRQAFPPPNRKVSDPYISPALLPFRSRVPMWIEAGTGEVAFDIIQRFAEEMQEAGTETGFYAVPHGTHAQMWSPTMIGFDPIGSIRSFAAFVKKHQTF